MPGRSGRNKYSVLVGLTETNLAAHRVANPAKKPSVDRWLDHVALPSALRQRINKLPPTIGPDSAPALSEGWVDRVARRIVEIARGLPALAVVRLREGVDGAGEEDAGSEKSKKKRKKGKKWYH